MKALIDTNILLDVILCREPHLAQSKRVLQCCESLVDGYIAVHTFSNMFYIHMNWKIFLLMNVEIPLTSSCMFLMLQD